MRAACGVTWPRPTAASYHWLVDLEARAVTAHRLESGRWVTIGVYGDEAEARIEPFDVVPIDVASWWPPESPR
jgi:hypothetical protein